MNEKEMLIANVRASEEVGQQITAKEGDINKLLTKKAARRKATGGESLMGRILWFMFIYCCLFSCGTAIIIGTIGKIWSPLGTLACLIFCGYMIYFYFVGGFVLNDKIKKTQNELKELEQSPQLSWIPAEYRTSSCITAIISYVQSGRADTMKEVLNLLETDMHNQRMENAAALGAYYGAQSGRL